MQIDVRVPALSESVTSGTLLGWRRALGDAVTRDEPLVDLETDKVILEVPAPASGRLTEIVKPEGAVVTAGEVIARIETEAVADSGTAKAVAAPPAPQQPAPPAPQPPTATPAPAPATPAPAAPVSAAPAPVATPRSAATAGERREKMSRIRARIAERLLDAQRNTAMLTTFNEVDMHAVNDLRQRYKAEFAARHGVRLGYMSFFVRAVCLALAEFPILNAAIDGDEIVWHDRVDLGIAVSTPRGLVVPVLRDAAHLNFAEIEQAIDALARRARDAKLTLEDLSGGTFSITNGGVFGSLLSTPILNPPQSGILGMHTIQDRPVAENGQVVIRPMMYLALTYDHRLVDGRDAVQFLVAVKGALEAPERLLIGV